MPYRRIALMAVALALASTPARSDDSFPVATSSLQDTRGDLIADGQGGAFVSWIRTESSGAQSGTLFITRLGPNGKRVWADDLWLSDEQTPTQHSQLVSDGNGGAFVLWPAPVANVLLQHVSRAGHALWSAPIVVNDAAVGSRAGVVSDGSGGVIVAWSDWRSGTEQVFAQRVNGAGSMLWPAGHPIGAGAFGGKGWIANSKDGGAFLTWVDQSSGVSQARVQRLSPTGALVWHAGGAVVRASAKQQLPGALVTANNGAILAWTEGDETNMDLFATAFNPQGQLRWANGTRLVCHADHTRSNISAVPDGFGGAFVAWDDSRTHGLPLPHVYGQHILTNGTMLWASNGSHLGSAPADGFESESSIAADDHGGAWIMWTEADALDGELLDIHGVHMNSDGSNAAETPDGGVVICDADGMQHQPAVINLGNGRVLADWVDQRQGDTDIDLYAWMSGVSGLATAGASPYQLGLHFAAHSFGDGLDVSFELPQAERVSLLVTDVQGRALGHTSAFLGQGSHRLGVHLAGARGQLVFVALRAGPLSQNQKLLLSR